MLKTPSNPFNACRTDLSMRFIVCKHLLKCLHDGLLEGCELSLSPPIRDLAQPCAPEMFLERLVVALVRGEERREVLDRTFAQGSSEVIHGLVEQVGFEHRGDDRNRDVCRGAISRVDFVKWSCEWREKVLRTVLDKMVFRQTLQAAGAGETLREQEAGCCGEFFSLGFGPAIDVLEETRQGSFFQGSLKVFVPIFRCLQSPCPSSAT